MLEAPPEVVEKVADRLDAVAERCGPAIVTYSNPAKTLASELAESLPVVWTEGTSAGPAGRRFAAALVRARPARPALAADLPEALAAHGALLAGRLAAGADPDDFFRDRVESRRLRARVQCCSAKLHPAADSPPRPAPVTWPSDTTRRSANWSRKRAANWRPSPN
ncbi:hypothetical protein STENM327S_07517 [Streptomyces tendae]